MNTPFRRLPIFLYVPLLSAAAGAAEVYSESFDDPLTAKLGTVNGTAVSVQFVDYSAMTVGSLTHNIPEAPRQIAGSQPAKGLFFRNIYQDPDTLVTTAATERIANIVLQESSSGPRYTFVDNYRLKFDFYLRIGPSVTPNANGIPPAAFAGTTEQMLWGVGYNSSQPMGRGFRTTRGSGSWGWLSTEGGHGSTVGADASLYINGALSGGRNMDLINAASDTSTYFTPAFGADATPLPHCPANQWVMADITVLAGKVTVQYQAQGRTAAKFFENVAGNTAGGMMIGYEDSFSSISFDPDNQWMLLDNITVEDLTPPTMIVNPLAAITTYTGQTVPFTYTINNTRFDADLNVSAVTFGGTHSADFSVVTPLPLVVPPGQTATLELAFHPAAPNGLKTASMTIVSDDPQTPSFVVSGLSARRSAPGFLAAHYKLNESSGTTFADSSGNNFPGGAQVREPLVFGQPSLLGEGSPGTATGFLPAQTGTTGNYFTSNVTHTPSFSASLWIKPADSLTNRTIFQRDPDFDATYEELCGLILDPGGRLIYRVNAAEVLNSDAFLETIVSGNTYHIVLTHSDTDGFGNTTASRSRLYINGRLIAEKAGAEAPGFDEYPANPTVSAMHIGSRTAAGFGYSGDLDDIQLYGAELTKEQVWSLYKSPGSIAPYDWNISTTALITDPPGTRNFTVTVPASPDGSYRLFRRSALTDWTAVGDPQPGSMELLQLTLSDPDAPQGSVFYHVQRQP
jgi:Concanavalin A-like lectin/glucanases superfamily